jgi:hypothetical protein
MLPKHYTGIAWRCRLKQKSLRYIISGFWLIVCPEGFEPPSAEPESAILSIELWAHTLVFQSFKYRYSRFSGKF